LAQVILVYERALSKHATASLCIRITATMASFEDAQSQMNQNINQMTSFILNEAKDKAEEISAAALQDYSVAKAKFLREMQKDKIDKIHKELKKKETQRAIEKSTAVNKSRLEKIKARQNVLGRISSLAREDIAAKLRSESEMGAYLTKLIVQGMLMLVEDEVTVRCRAADEGVVQSILGDAQAEYSRIIKDETNADKTTELTLDSENKLPANGIGGVVLTCQFGSITVDNTIDSRLELVMEQAKPRIRQLLFDA